MEYTYVDTNIHGHSFSIGAATITEALAGVQNTTIVPLGDWYSAAFLQCNRMTKDQLVPLSQDIANTAFQSYRN